MGHHWPGADWPENDDSDRRRPDRGPGWSHTWTSGPGGRRASGPPPWLSEIFGFAAGTQAAPQRGPEGASGRRPHRDHRRPAPGPHRRGADQRLPGDPGDLRAQQRRVAPLPGSVYPTIQQLQDEGLVESDDERGRRTIRLTDAGVAGPRTTPTSWPPSGHRSPAPSSRRATSPPARPTSRARSGRSSAPCGSSAPRARSSSAARPSTCWSTPAAASTASSRTDGTASDERVRPAPAHRRQRP